MPLSNPELESILNRVQTWTHQVDEKVNILITAQVGLFAFVLDPTMTWFSVAGWQYQASIAVGLILQVAAIWQAGRVLFPNTGNPSPANSFTFFADIASRSLSDYSREIAAVSASDLEAELVSQIHVCAVIATAKFQHLRKSIALAGAGLGCLATAYVVFRMMS